jgi:hypothetical protein
MHFERTIGMLNTLAEKWNLSYGESTEDLAVSETITKVETGNEEISITICPGYVTREEGKENLTQALKEGTYDAVLSAVGVNDVLDQLLSAEKEAGQDMLIGTVDCFSQENYDAILADDAYGNAEINYVKGKYASMVGPAFAALYNAMEGDLDVVKPDGEAFRLYQGFWSASGRDQYREMYGYTQDVYENAYSCADLMKVIKAFDEDADFDQLKALTEAYDLDSVKERILNADK